jgi:hypothetical protein
MNQHSIQEAYLKNYCVDGKLWAHDVNTKTALLKSASRCTSEEDFQSEILEKIQNDTIESPGIKSLKKLLDGKSITLKEYDLVRYWTGLHIIRNQKFRNVSNINYKSDYKKLIDIENKFSHYFPYCHKYKCDNGKYLVTSDNPILEFSVGVDIVRFLTISPEELLLFTPVNNIVHHEELEFTEMINSMLWANAYSKVFSNKKVLPYSTYEKNIKKWDMVGVYEETKFITKAKNQ